MQMEDNGTTTEGYHYEIGEDFHDFPEFSMVDIYDRVFLPSVVPVCLIGIVGSVLCILVLGRHKSINDATRFILQILAVADAMYLFITMFDCIMYLAKFHQVVFHCFYLLFRPMQNMASTAMLWLVFLATMDRYLAIYRPRLAVIYGTPIRLKLAICIVWVTLFVINFPLYFEYTVTHDGNHDFTYFESTSILTDKVYVMGFRVCFYLIVCLLLPLSVTVALIHRLKHHDRPSTTSYSRQPPQDVVDDEATTVDNDRQLTTTLSNVVITFVVLESINLVLEAGLCALAYVSFFHDWHDLTHNVHWCFYMLHMSLKVAVSSFRCLVYALIIHDFRRALIDVMRCCCRRGSINGRADDEVTPYDVSFQGETIDISHELPLVVRQ